MHILYILLINYLLNALLLSYSNCNVQRTLGLKTAKRNRFLSPFTERANLA